MSFVMLPISPIPKTSSVRISGNLRDIPLFVKPIFKEDVCTRVKERFASLDFDEKKLGLEALNVIAKVTDDHVEVNAVLGVEESDPRLITTGQTSA